MVSTNAMHDFNIAGTIAGYGLSKNAGTLAMQLIARDTPAEDMQVVSFNPGPNLTANARTAGYTEESMTWNDRTLNPRGKPSVLA
jgi:hypothetical protein